MKVFEKCNLRRGELPVFNIHVNVRAAEQRLDVPIVTIETSKANGNNLKFGAEFASLALCKAVYPLKFKNV